MNIVSVQDCYIYGNFFLKWINIFIGKHVLVCMDNQGIVRAFSLPQLLLLMKQSLSEPHLLRG